MSQQVRVEIDLVFAGEAAYTANVKGNMLEEKVHLHDHFIRVATDESNDWTVNESHGGSGAINVAKGGTYRLTTTTGTEDKAELANALCWYASQNCVMEARIKVDDITDVAINVGFSDVAAESTSELSFEIDSNNNPTNNRATEGAAFVFDVDAGVDIWYMSNVKTNTEVTQALTGIAPENGTYETLRVALDSAGNATFYRNGVAVGYKALAVTTTVALTPYIGVMSRAGSAARNLDIHRIDCWQDED